MKGILFLALLLSITYAQVAVMTGEYLQTDPQGLAAQSLGVQYCLYQIYDLETIPVSSTWKVSEYNDDIHLDGLASTYSFDVVVSNDEGQHFSAEFVIFSNWTAGVQQVRSGQWDYDDNINGVRGNFYLGEDGQIVFEAIA